MTINVLSNSPALSVLETLNQLNGQVGRTGGGAPAASDAASSDSTLVTQDAAIWDVGPRPTNSVQAGLSNGLNQAASIADSAVSGSVTVLDLLDQLRQNARTAADPATDPGSRSDLNVGYKTLLARISDAVSQSGFGGVNLLDGSLSGSLQVASDGGASTVTLSATNLALGGPVISLASTSSIGSPAAATAAIGQLDSSIIGVQRALAQISVQNQAIQSHLGIVARAGNAGSTGVTSQVTSAINQDGARLLALQVQQTLASSQTSIAGQGSQAILSLFR